MNLTGFAFRKAIAAIITIFAILCVNFLIFRIAPGDPVRMMAELLMKDTGYCRGRGGSMHIAEVDKQNNLGSTGIVGGNQPPAVGAALALCMANRGADRMQEMVDDNQSDHGKRKSGQVSEREQRQLQRHRHFSPLLQ